MKKFTSKVLALALGATIVVGSAVGLTGCGDEKTADVDSEIYAVYLASGTELSYDEWYAELLASAKGDKGDKGEDGVGIKSATLNEHGELVLEFTDGNQKNLGKVLGAAGQNGVGIENVEIGENGKLIVTYTDETTDEIDLELPQPHVHTWSDWDTVEAATCSSVGISKRTCEDESCDSEEYKLEKQLAHTYSETPVVAIPATCTEGGVEIYVCSECGNVKGEATEPNGHQYDESDTCTVCGEIKSVKSYGKVSIAASESYTLDLSGIENGTYSVVAKAEGEAAVNTLLVSTNHAGNSTTYTYDMYMPVSKTYQSVLFIKDGKETASVKNNSEETIEVELSIVKYKAPTIKLGEEVDVACVIIQDGFAPVMLDSSIVADGSTTYKLSMTSANFTGIGILIMNQASTGLTGLAKAMSYSNPNYTFPEGTTELRFQSTINPGSGASAATSAMNITIKVESAA